MTRDVRHTIRDELVASLASAEGADLDHPTHSSRVRQIFRDRVDSLLSPRASLPSDLRPEARQLVERYRENEDALAAERASLVNARSSNLAAFIEAGEPEPDHDHRRLVILDEATGKRFRVRFPVEWLERLHQDDAETAQEAAGLPFVRKATTAA